MTNKKLVNGVEVDMTADEITEFTAQNLQGLIDSKVAELEAFHGSTPTRTMTINNTYEIYLFQEYRNLVAEQISDIKIGIEDGDIIEAEATFNYYYNGDDSFIPVTYAQLKTVYRAMIKIVNNNFAKYREHTKTIKELTSEADVNDYDFSVGYLLEQNVDLT